jgi:heterodisulfide reductase subunit A-like polyferredoxin
MGPMDIVDSIVSASAAASEASAWIREHAEVQAVPQTESEAVHA